METWQPNPDPRELEITETSIPGLLSITMPVHGDRRGWFKENYQKEKMTAAGLPEWFEPIQNNISFNEQTGTTRGIHAEPWNKLISVGYGRVFAAIVDFRGGDTFGNIETFELTPETGIFVPKGCGNSFQTLTPNSVYTYLVDAHWSPDARYTSVKLDDEQLAVQWPVPLNEAIVSDKDLANPALHEISPMKTT